MLSFSGFYLFLYLGRFNFWPVAPLVKEDLDLSHVEIGLVTALLLWGFGLGDLIHGRLAEVYGLRLWILLGAVLTAVFNWITSFATSAWTMAIPWGICGFVNAACWSLGVSMISQWWPRQDRGMALGIRKPVAGGVPGYGRDSNHFCGYDCGGQGLVEVIVYTGVVGGGIRPGSMSTVHRSFVQVQK